VPKLKQSAIKVRGLKKPKNCQLFAPMTTASYQPIQTEQRYQDIDVGKGIAIFLVVVGHIIARDLRPIGNDWFIAFSRSLYDFHMAFFFYLAGYVFWVNVTNNPWGRYKKLLQRMLPAYALVAAIAFFAKFGLAAFVPIDRPLGAIPNEWLQLVLYPTRAFVSFLWFVIALLAIQAITIITLQLSGKKTALILAAALGLHILTVLNYVTEVFALHQIFRYWFIFVLANLAIQYRQILNPLMKHYWPLSMSALVAALLWIPTIFRPSICAIVSVAAIHGLSLYLIDNWPNISRGWAKLGVASWPIYLFNVFCIGATKVFILKTFGWNNDRFFIALPIMVVAGLFLPIVFQRVILRRIPQLDRITR
jgi:fucose 4-O-acetylase-like acetyltransferase